MIYLFTLIIVLSASFPAVKPAWGGDVRVAVALSIQEAYDELVRTHEQKNKNTRILSQYGSSQPLAKQIAAGAPADMFISSHPQWMEYLKISNHIEELLLINLASNSLVLIGKPDRQIVSINDLTTMSSIAVGSPGTAHGQYTLEALKNAGLEQQLKPKLIQGKNSHETLQLAEKGETEGAIIYRTEATHLKRTKILYTIPPTLHSPIAYQLALTKSGARNKDAVEFYRFLNSPAAKGILAKFGYTIK